MSERTSYTPGTPCWVDLATPDVEAAAAFYGDLFGWEVPELPNSAEMGGYRRAKLNGKDVAGVVPLMQEGQPPAWSTYISVTDAEATMAAVREAGGQVIFEPMEPADYGKLAVFTDPTGAFCGVWQPNTFAGAELVNEYGTFGWNELGTRDTAAAKEFYGAVFGWTTQDEESERVGTYTVWKAGDAMVGGMIDLSAAGVADEIPAHWLVYFTVEDTDAAVEKVKSGGGAVNFGPIDIPVGRFAVVADQFGAVFALMRPSEEMLAEMS
ncbi:MAG TPA: VOC family protein [Solirubrobacterales bacterium]|nr:VOC family protein [Solirubrobacterales bacterium]